MRDPENEPVPPFPHRFRLQIAPLVRQMLVTGLLLLGIIAAAKEPSTSILSLRAVRPRRPGYAQVTGCCSSMAARS